MDAESVSCGAIPKNPANSIRAPNWQGPSAKASAGRGMIRPGKGNLRISNTNIFTVSIPQFTPTVGPIGTEVPILVRVQGNYAIDCNQELSRMIFGGRALINGRTLVRPWLRCLPLFDRMNVVQSILVVPTAGEPQTHAAPK
jgi:hypothetical protein